ncbi:cytochrome P450 71A1-like [Camellia sinensis]|nr:cytochrome P450 71A1-like [Camellia sinensis]
MFIGGTDTTSTAIEWAMTELIKNPTKLKKAQEEVRRVEGEKSKVNEDDIDQMVYLNWVVKEALSLRAPIPYLFRQESIGNESTKLGGYDIPPGARVFINAWAIHRDPKIWDNPEDFVPERFANNLIDFTGQDFNFNPFGAGRRGCPGFSFGVLIVEYVLANLLYWFDWKYPSGPGREEDFDMSEVTSLVVDKKIPLQLVPVLHSPSFIT